MIKEEWNQYKALHDPKSILVTARDSLLILDRLEVGGAMKKAKDNMPERRQPDSSSRPCSPLHTSAHIGDIQSTKVNV